MPELEARKARVGALLAPLIKGLGGAVKATQYAPAHIHRKALSLRDVSPHVGEHLHPINVGLGEFPG